MLTVASLLKVDLEVRGEGSHRFPSVLLSLFPGSTSGYFTCVYSTRDAVVVARVHRGGSGGRGEAEIQKQAAATSNSRSPGNREAFTRELGTGRWVCLSTVSRSTKSCDF